MRSVPYHAYPLRSAYFGIFFKVVLGRLSIFSPIWCAIIWCKPHCAVLNYLEPVAPCRSIRDGEDPVIHADLHRTGWSYCAPYYIIAESAESTESAERPESAERRRKGKLALLRPVSGDQLRPGQLVVEMAGPGGSGLQRKLYIINKL